MPHCGRGWIFPSLGPRALSTAPTGQFPAASRFSPQYELGAAEPAISKLPQLILDSIRALFKGYPRRDLRPAIQHLLALHREACQIKAEHILPQMRSTNQPLPSLVAPDELPRTIPEYGDEQCMAYVAWQMPLAYGCLERIMTDLKKRIPTFNPQTIFDFGTGPGTAIIAALLQWPSSIESIKAVDISEHMLEMTRRFLDCLLTDNKENGDRQASPNVTIDLGRFLSLSPPRSPSYDLAMAAFSLGDLPDDGVRRSTVSALWEQTRDILILVERGTPEGSRIISNARTQLLSLAGYLDAQGETIEQAPPGHGRDISITAPLHIIAPCPHERKCPMLGSWCHFAHRVELNVLQQELNPPGRGFVDQKFSYLVVRRRPRATIDHSPSPLEQSFSWPRLIRRPLKRPGHIINDVCSPKGSFERIIVPKSQSKQIYYDARKCKWGDLWPHPPKNNPIPLTNMKITKHPRRKGSD